jgi:hypothetical protein
LGQQRFLPLDLLELNNFFPTMTTSIRVRFAGLHRQYTAVPWNIPNHPYPFQPIPADATSIVVPTGGIFINGQGHRLPEKLTLDEAPTWGYNDDENDTEIIFAQATSPTSRFCLRMVLDVNKVIRDKKSKRYRTLSRLVKDAKFHSTYLAYAEGLMVPIHYGMWQMDTGDWASKILFSITQWCGISWNELSHTRMNTEANRYESSPSLYCISLIHPYSILVGRTFEALHDHGVQWGNLADFEDFRHAIIDVNAPGLSREDLLNGKAPCYIVGFSEAYATHYCMRKLPILPLGSYVPLEEVCCDEIASVLILLDFMEKSEISMYVS